jgi:hypothetical protein
MATEEIHPQGMLEQDSDTKLGDVEDATLP